MNSPEIEKKLDRVTLLLTINLVVMGIVGIGIIAGLLPMILKVANTTERVEQRFQEFADEVQPVVATGAGKAIETIKQIDAGRLSETATESSDELIRAAGDRAKRYFDRKKVDE